MEAWKPSLLIPSHIWLEPEAPRRDVHRYIQAYPWLILQPSSKMRRKIVAVRLFLCSLPQRKIATPTGIG